MGVYLALLLLCGALNPLVSYFFRVQDPPCCAMLGIDQSQAMERVSELQERPSSCPGEQHSVSQVTCDPEVLLPFACQSLEQLAASPLLKR